MFLYSQFPTTLLLWGSSDYYDKKRGARRAAEGCSGCVLHMQTKRRLHFLASFGGDFEIRGWSCCYDVWICRNTDFGGSRPWADTQPEVVHVSVSLFTNSVRQKLFSKLQHYSFCMFHMFEWKSEQMRLAAERFFWSLNQTAEGQSGINNGPTTYDKCITSKQPDQSKVSKYSLHLFIEIS